MARRRPPEEYSVEDLRQLLIEKRRKDRQARLDHYRRSGRLVMVEPTPQRPALESMRSQPLSDEAEETRPVKTPRSARRRWVDRVLTAVEIIAVVGLVFVFFNGFNVLRNLNREVASVLEQATLTPTPLISAVVLPSGHTPPNSPNGIQPNEAEIPEHLRPLVQSLANLPVPTPGPEQAVRIQIPAINVDAPVVQGDGWEQLKKGVGQHIGTANPGREGNLVLSAHNDIFGEIFRDLDRLKKGDQIIVFTSNRTYTYVVREVKIVEPTQVEVMAPTREPVTTLISCYPYLVDNQRIAVIADIQQ